MEEIKLDVEVHGLDKKLEKHASEIGFELVRRVNKMLRHVENNVKLVTHRGYHCKGKGGTTKSAIKHRLSNNGGLVFVDEGIAPWFRWYYEGRPAVEAKGKENGGANFLRFCTPGGVVYRRRVKAWKGHDVLKEGLQRSEPGLQKEAQSLGRWLVEL